MTEKYGSITASVGRWQSLIGSASMSFFEDYSDLYFHATDDDVVRTILNRPTEDVCSYCTFAGLQVEVEDDAALEAVVDLDEFYDYFDFVAGAEDVTVTFYGDGDNLPSHYTISGDLEATVYTKTVDTDGIATGLFEKFNDDDEFVTKNGETLPVAIEADASALETIKQAVDSDRLDISLYTVTIEDGDLTLDVTDEQDRNGIAGALESKDIRVGQDVDNTYSQGFEDLSNAVDGQVRLETFDDGPLIAVEQSGDDTYRHLITPSA